MIGSVIEASMGLALVAAAIGIAVVAIATMMEDVDDTPLRRWRKMHTPPCRLCANHAAKSDPDFARIVWDACRCRRAIDRSERLDGAHADWLLCKKVRGTRYCAFEPKEEER